MAEQVKRPKEVMFTSPKGAAKWAKLNIPDTKFKPEGAYSVELVLDPEDAATIEFVAKIEAAHEAGYIAAKKADPKKKYTKQDIKIKPETTKDGEPTGKTIVSFTAKASGTRKKDNSKWTFRPALFDAKRVPLPNDIVVFGGSLIKVSYSIRHTPMPTGLFYTTLSLKAVQVLDLKAMGSRDASEYGFEDEDGFTSDPASETPTSTGEAQAPADGSADF